MADTIFTFPGKLGDNLFRLPIAYQYAIQNNCVVDLCFDEGSKILVNLVKTQDWVENSFVSDGIVNHHCGGQPVDFGKDEWFKSKWKNVFHLGFRSFPNGHFGVEACIHSGTPIDPQSIFTSSCFPGKIGIPNNLLIHVESAEPWRAKPSEDLIKQILPKVYYLFNKVHIISILNEEEVKQRYQDMLSLRNVSIHNDNGNLIDTVNLMRDSILIGTYGSMWALASCVKSRQVVIFSPSFPFSQKITTPEREKVVLEGDQEGLIKWIQHLKNV